MLIYKVTNQINNKIYIGQTINSLKKRWHGHIHNNANSMLTNAIKKYGKENFIIEQIDSALTIEELNNKEVYWINHYNSTNREIGYNLKEGGKNSPCPEVTRKKISEVRKKTILSKDTLKKLSELGRAYRHTSESKKKMSKNRIGIRVNNKLIVAIDKNGVEYKFDAIIDAANELKISRTGISNVLNGLSKTSGGYMFKYYKNEEVSIGK